MKDHDGDVRGFSHVSRAWYGYQIRDAAYTDEVMFGFYSPDGGTSGEMCMRWYELNHTQTPRLEAFNDAWHALAQMPDVLAALADADDQDITPDEFCRVLVRLGFKDNTPVDDERRTEVERRIHEATERIIAEQKARSD